NAKVQIGGVQPVSLDGVAALKVSTVDLTDDLSAQICKQDWYFDPNTLLPVRVDFLTSQISNALDTATMTYLYSNYQNFSGISFPLHVVTLVSGHQIEEVTFASVQVGASIPPTEFDAPSAVSGGAL